MKKLTYLALLLSIVFISCKSDPEVECIAVYPSIRLVNFDSTDLKTMCAYQYRQYGNFDSLIGKDSIGANFVFPYGNLDTFMVCGVDGVNYGSSYIKLLNSDYKITMQNGVEIKIFNYISQKRVCKIPYGERSVFCPCSILNIEIKTVNCTLNKIDQYKTYISK